MGAVRPFFHISAWRDDCASRIKEIRQGKTIWKVLPKCFKYVVCNPCQSSPSLTIPVLLWFIIISLVLFYLCKVLFSGFLQFNSNFLDSQNNSKYRDCAPLSSIQYGVLLVMPYYWFKPILCHSPLIHK